MIYKNFLDFIKALPEQGALVSLDYGIKRIGVAVCDPDRSLVTPLFTLHRKRFDLDLKILDKTITERSICGIVIGLPLNMDGSSGPRVQSTRAYARNLSKTLVDIPIGFYDERLSSFEAQDLMIQAGTKRTRHADYIDALAAAVILENVVHSRYRTAVYKNTHV